MLVTDSARLRGRDLVAVVSDAVDGGVNVVQLREKSLSHAPLVALATRMRDAIGGRARLLVNSDVEAAIDSGADGVHLPTGSVSIADVRARIGPAILISCAVHSAEEALAAERDGADLLVLGSVFPSATHPDGAVLGVDAVAAICARTRIPVIGIGGVTPHNATSVMRAGASGIAVISAIFDADDACAAACDLSIAIGAGSPFA
jgi:thiamine-phosphate pyrophosphorylase